MMRNIARASVLAIFVGVTLSGSQMHLGWRWIASEALDRFEDLDSGNETTHAYAYAAGATAILNGWNAAMPYLERVQELRQADGGYGLGTPFDAFRDGSTNPADTTYTITVAEHVGRIYLEAYDAGIIPREPIENLIDILLELPRLDDARGTCLAYSDAPGDRSYCVPNVNAMAGWFLAQVIQRGFERPGLQNLVDRITTRDASTFRGSGWPYIEGDAELQSRGYNAVNAEAHLTLRPWLGMRALEATLRQPPATWTDDLGSIRLLPFACRSSDDLLAAGSELLADRRVDARFAAQLAHAAAAASSACGTATPGGMVACAVARQKPHPRCGPRAR